MNGVLGNLYVRIAGDLTRLKADMDQAKTAVGQGASAIATSLRNAVGAFSALAGAVGVGALAAWVKTGIEAADTAFQISQKAGVAVRDVAGLQLAFQLATGSSDGMVTAMAKLSRQMSEGNAAFALLGVNTKNADGSLRSTKDVLYDTADAFAGMQDGASKTALAMEIFGKSGAEMLPLLNSGADGLREMAEMAERLGLVIDEDTAEAADKFNDTLDLLKSSSTGVASQLAAQLLPALNAVAGGLLDTLTQGDGVRKMAVFLGTALKGLYTILAGGIQIVSTLGQGLGALGATIAAVLSGNFSGAKSIISDFVSTAKTDWTSTINNIGAVWDGTAGKTAEAGAKMAKAMREVTVPTREAEAASKAAAAAKQKEIESYQAFTGKIADLILKQQAELEQGEKLSEADKLAVEAKKKLTGAELEAALASIAVADALGKQIEQRKREQAAIADAAKARLDGLKAQDAEVEKLEEQLAAQLAANETLRTGVDRTNELAIARLRDAAAAAERQAIIALDKNLDTEVYEGYKRQAEALRALADAREAGIGLQAAKAANDAWSKTAGEIGQGLTDSLYRAFEAGGDFFGTLWAGIKNTFKTTVLRMVIDPVMKPIGAAISSIFGSGSAMAGGGGAAGGGGLGGMIGNLVSGAGAFGGSLGAGWGATMGAGFGGTGLALEGAMAMLGEGQIMSGLGQALGALGPYAMAIGLIAQAFKHTPTHHKGSVVTADATGVMTGGADPTRILNNFDAGTDDALKSLAGGSVDLLNMIDRAFGGSGGFSANAKFAADGKDASFGAFNLLRNGSRVGGVSGGESDGARAYTSDAKAAFEQFGGDVGAAVRAALGVIDLPQWASDALAALGDSPGLDKLTAAAQEIIATQQALNGLSDALTPLGGIFERIAGLSEEAKMQLAGMVGGIDALVAKSRSFVENYYSEEEQLGIAARDILTMVQKAGVDSATFEKIAGLTDKTGLRALLESVDVAGGQNLDLAALGLNIAGPFAQIAAALEASGKTLGELASTAITPIVQQLLEQAEASASAAEETGTLEGETESPAEAAAVETAAATADTAAATAEAVTKLTEIAENTGAQLTVMGDGLRGVIAVLQKIEDRVKTLEDAATLASAAPETVEG